MNSFFSSNCSSRYIGCSVDNPRKKSLPKCREKSIKVPSYEKSIEFFKKKCFKIVYMDTYNAVFTCSIMLKKFRQKAYKVPLHVRGWWNFLSEVMFFIRFSNGHGKSRFFKTAGIFRQKMFRSTSQSHEHFFFSEIFFWKCIYGQVEYGFRHNPMEKNLTEGRRNFAQCPIKIFSSKNFFPQSVPRYN